MSRSLEVLRNDRIRSLRSLFITLNWIAYKHLIQCLQKYNLTHPQFITLVSLVKYGQPATMSELSEVAVQDAPTMTGIVNRLIKMDLVQRTRHDQDRRIVLVEATAAGKLMAERVRADLEAEDVQGFAGMSDEDLTKFETLLDYLLHMHLRKVSKTESKDFAAAKQTICSFADDPITFVKKFGE